MTSVLRRAANPRVVEGPPNLRPIKTRFSQGSGYGSACSTPRVGTPKLRSKRRRAFYVLQAIVLLSLGIFMFRHSDGFSSSPAAGSSAGVRKRQLISSQVSGFKDDQDELSAARLEAESERIQALADALLAESEAPTEVSMYPVDSEISGVFAHPTTGPSGAQVSYFYRFTNVKVSEGGIDVFAGPSRKQPKSYAFDVVLVNSTSPQPPTSLVLQPTEIGTIEQRTIPVRYLAQQRSASACSKWVEEPTLLLHSRYPDNMWHTWTEGLIPSFQTLRELGYLPLMEISPVGAVREVTEGVAFKQCPQVADTATATVRVAVDCMQKRGLAAGAPTFCNSNDTWCMPGVWSHIAPGDAVKRPGLLYVDDKVLDNDWGSLYTAMVGAVRSFSAADGTCFRNLIVGTSRTLRAAEKMSSGGESGESQVRLERMADALDVFVRFARSAQHRLQVNNAIEFLGYDNFYGEKLRAGVSFGQAFANIIDHTFEEPVAVLPANNPSVALLEDWEDLKHQKWMFSTERQSLTGKSKLAQVAAEAAERVLPSPVGPPPEHRLQDPRPVVTYISRWGDLNRAIVNERQVLRYIYWSYNVTLRVTSMTEHVEAVAALLAETDVLIGTHCAGWTHAMFLKPGASTLQLLPYGWRRKDGSLLRGELIRTLVHLRRGSHLDWVNPHGEFSFFRRDDFSAEPAAFRAHPAASGEWAEPEGDAPHPAWLNANTYADINHLGLYIDEAMKQAGIPKMDPALVAQLKAAKLQDRIAKETQRAVEVDVDSANAAAGAWEEADGQQLGALDESVPEEQGEDAWDEEDVDGEAEVETVDEDPEALR